MNPSISAAERLARIQINACLFFRADWLERLIEIFGSAQEILRQDAPTLSREANLNPDTAARLLKDAHAVNPQEEWDKTTALGGHIYVPEDDEYPQSLRNIKESPTPYMCWAPCRQKAKPAWVWWARAKLRLMGGAPPPNWRAIWPNAG